MSRGLDPPLFAQDQPKLGEGISGWVQQWQTPQAITDITTDARNRPSQPVLESSAVPLEHYGVASTLCIPIQLGEEVLGVIHAMTSHRRLFTVSEMELLYTIANQAAVAIVNAMNHKDARARAHMVSRYFRRVARAIGSSLEVQDVPQMFANVACEIMRADRCALYRIENGELILRAASRFAATIPPAESIPAGHVLAGSVAKRGQPIVITDLRDDERVAGQDWIKRDKLASYLAIPLKSKRKTVGVVEIYTVDRREFLSEEIQLFSTFAKRANVAEKLAHEVSIA